MKRIVLSLLILLALPTLALTQGVKNADQAAVHSITLPDVPIHLKAGPGEATTAKYCGICHTTGYIPMQPGFPEAKWAAIVEKMRKVFGAPVSDKAAGEIARYLGTHYGPGD